jgi:hypothetical protein
VRYNSQGYPWSRRQLQDELFKTMAGARTFARENFGAQPGEYASKQAKPRN